MPKRCRQVFLNDLFCYVAYVSVEVNSLYVQIYCFNDVALQMQQRTTQNKQRSARIQARASLWSERVAATDPIPLSRPHGGTQLFFCFHNLTLLGTGLDIPLRLPCQVRSSRSREDRHCPLGASRPPGNTPR